VLAAAWQRHPLTESRTSSVGRSSMPRQTNCLAPLGITALTLMNGLNYIIDRRVI
jgi:hypothetical protein